QNIAPLPPPSSPPNFWPAWPQIFPARQHPASQIPTQSGRMRALCVPTPLSGLTLPALKRLGEGRERSGSKGHAPRPAPPPNMRHHTTRGSHPEPPIFSDVSPRSSLNPPAAVTTATPPDAVAAFREKNPTPPSAHATRARPHLTPDLVRPARAPCQSDLARPARAPCQSEMFPPPTFPPNSSDHSTISAPTPRSTTPSAAFSSSKLPARFPPATRPSSP